MDNIYEVVRVLKSLHSKGETNVDNLNRTYDTCVKLFDLIQESNLSSNDEQFQNAVQLCIKSLENCTVMVNELDLFSTNERVDEIQTSSLKFLMLPSLLGSLSLSLQTKELPERLKYLEISEVYFKDFLFRCKNYELSKNNLLDNLDSIFDDSESEDNQKKQSIVNLVTARESKIKQYMLKKELSERANELKLSLHRSDLEEYNREYYLVNLEKWILTAFEEVENIRREKLMLENIVGNEKIPKRSTSNKSENKPLKPFIITKNELQKKVFGYGYPSLPVMTIDDFYRMRFEKEINKQRNNYSKSLQDKASAGESLSKEEEEIHKEILLDKDDMETLKKARAWDDWKDDNPRGSGNRYNKG